MTFLEAPPGTREYQVSAAAALVFCSHGMLAAQPDRGVRNPLAGSASHDQAF